MMVRAWPPSTMDQGERALSNREIRESPCTNLVRRFAGDYPGIVMSSETVSRSDQFGNIYRYRIVQSIEDKGETHQIQSILVVWSKNCVTVELATYPTFRLPGSGG